MKRLVDTLVKDRTTRPIPEVVSKAVGAFQQLSVPRSQRQKDNVQEDVAKYIKEAKLLLFGDDGHEPTKENVLALVTEAAKTDLLSLIVKHLAVLEFETRKDVAMVFGAIVRIKDGEQRSPGAIYVEDHNDILNKLFDGYDDPAIALNCGAMLRDCLRDEALAKLVLENPKFMTFFNLVEVPNFEIASDAFATFKDLLLRHKQLVSQYLQDNYTLFFEAYSALLKSQNYVTRRQSLKLLGEMLLDRSNVKVMVRYVSEVSHLMVVMNLLKDSARGIQFEAFHVFKVFVANPNKPQAIVDILTNNREKLLKYLEDFHTDKDEDEQFKEEKAVIIREISTLGAAASASTS